MHASRRKARAIGFQLSRCIEDGIETKKTATTAKNTIEKDKGKNSVSNFSSTHRSSRGARHSPWMWK